MAPARYAFGWKYEEPYWDRIGAMVCCAHLRFQPSLGIESLHGPIAFNSTPVEKASGQQQIVATVASVAEMQKAAIYSFATVGLSEIGQGRR